MKKTFLKGAVLAVAAVGLMAGGAMANLLTNGDFESGDLTGWDASDTTVEYVGGAYGYAALLNDPNSAGAAALAQTFYISSDINAVTVSFDYLFEGTDTSFLFDDHAAGIFQFKVNDALIGASVENIVLGTLDSSSGLMDQVAHYSATVSLEGLFDVNPNSMIAFGLCESGLSSWWDNTDTQLWIDNVDVAPVPEPATMLLFGTGLAGLAGIRRRKAQKNS